MVNKTGAPAEVMAVLRAYTDAVLLIEPLQLKVWKTAGVTLTQLRILRTLREGVCSATELAQAAGLSAPSLTRVLDRLQDLGLVRRSSDPTDRRRIGVRITPAGEDLLGNQHVWADTTFARVVEEMTSAERQEFVHVIRSFVSRVLDAQRAAQQG